MNRDTIIMERMERMLKELLTDLEMQQNIIKDVERISFYLQELDIPQEAKESFIVFKKSFLKANKGSKNKIRSLERNLEESRKNNG